MSNDFIVIPGGSNDFTAIPNENDAQVIPYFSGAPAGVVRVQIAGVNVGSGLFSAINFVSGFTAVDAGGGVVNVTATGSSGGASTPPVIALSTASVTHAEGASGSTGYVYTVTRAGDLSGASSANWAVTGSGANPANATDFTGGVLPSGTVNFAAGASTATITINVAGDSTVEPDENFTLTLSSPSNATIGTATASGTITNDDTAAVKFLAEGDSITAYTSPDSYSRLWAADHPSLTYTDNAVGGAATGGSGDTPPTNTLYARQAGDLAWSPTHMSVLIGANDIGQTTVASTWIANLYNYLAPFKSAGVKIILCTILARNLAWWDAARGPINAQLRTDAGTQFDYLVDFDTCSMGLAATAADTAYFADGLHPTAAGHAILKNVYATVVNHAVGISNDPLNFSFAPQAAATLSTDYISPTYTVSGLYPGESRPYSVSSGGYISKNGGAFVQNGSGTVINGDTIRVRNHSASTNATDTTVTATIGGVSASYTVTTAGAGTRDWLPTDLGTKLACWLRPEDYAAAADGAEVATWHDASGNVKDWVGAGPSGKPTVSATAGVNGFKTVYFQGAKQSYFDPAGTPSEYLNGRTSSATFAVSRNQSDPNTTYFSAPFAGWGGNGDEYFPYTDGNVYSGYGSSTRYSSIPTAPDLSQWHIINFHSAANDWNFYIDGAQIYHSASNVVAMGAGPKIGKCTSIASAFDGWLEELVDLNAAPTATERQKIEGYLAWKYGLQANLPAGHPYLSAKPTV